MTDCGFSVLKGRCQYFNVFYFQIKPNIRQRMKLQRPTLNDVQSKEYCENMARRLAVENPSDSKLHHMYCPHCY